MGWKASFIIINKPTEVVYEELLSTLGFKNIQKIEDEAFDSVINPEDNTVYIGTFNNNLIICAQDKPMEFFLDTGSLVESALSTQFPNSEICAIVLHSVVNLWGYSIFKNGERIRTRAGSADDGTFIEEGEPMEEEKELLSHSTLDEDGQRTYILDEEDKEPMTEDQVGENFVFAITKRYFGEELDYADDLFDTTFKGYLFGNSSSTKIKIESSNETKTNNKPWWKFW